VYFIVISGKEKNMETLDIIGPIVTSIGSFVTGLGTGCVNAFKALFLTDANALNPLAYVMLALVGISVGFGIFAWIKSLLHR
jgi:xanthosine utilization system XapX-like protein